MNLADVVRALISIGVAAVLFAEGMRVDSRPIAELLRRKDVIARYVLAVVVAVPLVAAVVVVALRPPREVTAGLGVLAASPGAPLLLPRLVKLGRGAAYAPAMHLLLTALAVVTAPLVLAALSIAPGFEARAAPLDVGQKVLVSVFAPVVAGRLVQRHAGPFAARFGPLLERLALLILLGAILVLVVVAGRVLLRVEARSYLAMALVVLASLGVGHLLAPPRPDERTALALESAARNPMIAILIAAHNFRRENILPVLLPYLLIQVAVINLYATWRMRARAGAGDASR
ncbi:MAG: bile acid:sodium symporter [Polyangiaceae bacterium]|nr:bile acid:sodium symporter [Polyangiaceae bacterium]